MMTDKINTSSTLE